MKVICQHCKGLIDEKQAIKLNEFEYESLFLLPFNYDSSYYNRFTQICEKCYKKIRKEAGKK